mmetsp:Transcript_27827/g.86028  ORF Transcript_27827/g.86028 Transcript_27827/m.86028 type:complete len:219 (+) Transcript_27827:502-1158(+)
MIPRKRRVAREGRRVQHEVTAEVAVVAPELREAKVVADGQTDHVAFAGEDPRRHASRQSLAGLGAVAHVAQVHLVVVAAHPDGVERTVDGDGGGDGLADVHLTSNPTAPQEAEADDRARLVRERLIRLARLAAGALGQRAVLAQHVVRVPGSAQLGQHVNVEAGVGLDLLPRLGEILGLVALLLDLEAEHAERLARRWRVLRHRKAVFRPLPRGRMRR